MRRFLTIDQLAERYDICKTTAKKLPIVFTRVGRQRRYPLAAVERFELLNASRPTEWKAAVSEDAA